MTPIAANPFSHLAEDHRRLEEQLKVLDLAAGKLKAGPPSEHSAAIQLIIGVVEFFDGPAARHQAYEENYLLPRLRPIAAFSLMVGAFGAQHQMCDDSLRELKTELASGTLGSSRLGACLRRFIEMHRAHLMAEEKALFPLAQQLLPSDVEAQLVVEMAASS